MMRPIFNRPSRPMGRSIGKQAFSGKSSSSICSQSAAMVQSRARRWRSSRTFSWPVVGLRLQPHQRSGQEPWSCCRGPAKEMAHGPPISSLRSRRGGMEMGMTLMRCRRSYSDLPSLAMDSRSRLVAQTTRKSSGSRVWNPCDHLLSRHPRNNPLNIQGHVPNFIEK